MFNTNRPIIDLVIPGLLNLPIHELKPQQLALSTPCLHKLLRYANKATSCVSDFDDILIQRLGLQQSALPYAHAIRPGNKAHQLLFKPVHLKADINNAIVFPVDIEGEQIISIINDLKEFFKEDCGIEYLPDNRWLMTLYNCKPVTDIPHYLSALGNKVTHYLEQAKTNLQWFKLFNEIQMFLYQHEINQQRQRSGQPMINSLWCWGGDCYQGEKLTNTLWFSDDSDVQKIGELYAGNSARLADIKNTDINSDAVIIDLSILKLLKGHNDTDIPQALESVEQNCFEPLMKVNRHRIIVHTGGGLNFHYNSLSQLKFWKKPVQIDEVILKN